MCTSNAAYGSFWTSNTASNPRRNSALKSNLELPPQNNTPDMLQQNRVLLLRRVSNTGTNKTSSLLSINDPPLSQTVPIIERKQNNSARIMLNDLSNTAPQLSNTDQRPKSDESTSKLPSLKNSSNNNIFTNMFHKVKTLSKSSVSEPGLSFDIESLPGMDSHIKKENQDNAFVIPYQNSLQFFAGVFDGHGVSGGKISKFLSNFFQNNCDFINSNLNIPDELKKLYHAAEKALSLRLNRESQESGSTAATCIRVGKLLVVASVGDSRCVLARNDSASNSYKAIDMTSDHTPERPDEFQRITQKGGNIRRMMGGPPRVFHGFSGGLCVTRAFGDFSLSAAGVISKPEIHNEIINENDKFLILASDGVWAQLSSQEAVNIASKFIRDPSKAAKEILNASQEAWKATNNIYRDDITVVVIILN